MNALPLLGEIKTALKELLEKGEPYTIYSNKLPTTLEDRYFLQEVIGKGRWFMYERVLHTKAVAFNTEIPGVWLEVVFSERNPAEPILEMVQVNFSPPIFTIPKEDAERGFKKFSQDCKTYKGYLTPFALEVLEDFKTFLSEGKQFYKENPKGVENLTTYLITETELVIENQETKERIVSTNYYGLWLKYNLQREPVGIYIGDFPIDLKPDEEELKKAPQILEERKNNFLPKYKNKVDLPLL